MKYRRAMPILPVAAAIAVLLDGRPVSAYAPAYVVGGRTYAPLVPYVSRLVDRIAYAGGKLVLSRGSRQYSLRLEPAFPDALDRQYVALAPMLRALGISVSYDAASHSVDVVLPAPAEVASPQPFDPLAPQVTPHVVFTPTPKPALPIVWRGPAIPRRTPLPYPIPT